MSSYPPEKAGQPGSQSLPYRQTGGYASDDDAVPNADPSDMSRAHSAIICKLTVPLIDLRLTARTVAGLEACLWIS